MRSAIIFASHITPALIHEFAHLQLLSGSANRQRLHIFKLRSHFAILGTQLILSLLLVGQSQHTIQFVLQLLIVIDLDPFLQQLLRLLVVLLLHRYPSKLDDAFDIFGLFASGVELNGLWFLPQPQIAIAYFALQLPFFHQPLLFAQLFVVHDEIFEGLVIPFAILAELGKAEIGVSHFESAGVSKYGLVVLLQPVDFKCLPLIEIGLEIALAFGELEVFKCLFVYLLGFFLIGLEERLCIF